MKQHLVEALRSQLRFWSWLALLWVALPTYTANAAPMLQEAQGVALSYKPGFSNTQLITVRLNGKVSATFLLDTGITRSSISPSMAARLKLKAAPVLLPDGKPLQGKGEEPVVAVELNTLALGTLMLTNVPLVLPKEDKFTSLHGQKIDGVIGSNILINFAVLFDFQQHQVTLWEGGKLTATQRKQAGMATAYSALLADPTHDYVYTIQVHINHAAACDLVVDTGAFNTEIPFTVAQQLKLTPLGDLTLGTLYGPLVEHASLADTLQVGNFTAAQTVLTYAEHEDSRLVPRLGLDFLSQYRVLLDYPQKRIYFIPAERQTVTLPFSTAAEATVPLFDAKLSDGKVHILGLNLNNPSFLDRTVIKEQALQSTTPVLLTSVQLPTGKMLFDDSVFRLSSLGNWRQSLPVLEGWLGVELLCQSALSLDFSAKQMTLITPGAVAGTSFIAKDTVRVPLILTNQGYTLQMVVDGKPATFALNLLSFATVLNSKDLVHALQPQATKEEVGKDSSMRYLRLHQMTLGSVIVNDPVVVDRSTSNVGLPNVLGTDFLQRFHAILDFTGQALYLTPDPNYKQDPADVGVGIMPTITPDGRIFVAGLSVPSPAKEAGLEIDDEIMEMNGLTVSKTPLDKISAEFKKPEGTEITLIVQRKGEDKPREVKMKVRKLL